ncbi:hypothetical protein ACFE04_021922 [Oxalis oulophora]
MGKNGRPKMGSNKETPHSTSTSYLRAVRSNKCVPYIGAPVTIADVDENPRDCEDDDSKSNDNANTKCDNNPNSDGKYDDKDDTNDSKSDENSSTKCHNNHISDGKYDDNTSLALSKRKRKPVQRKQQEKKRKKNVKKHDIIKKNVPSPSSTHLRGIKASRRWHILKKRAIIKAVNIQQTHYAAFDWTIPLEKVGLMKSVTQMKSFLIGVIHNFYSNLILANADPNSKHYHRFEIRSSYLDFSPEKINKFLDRKDDEFDVKR